MANSNNPPNSAAFHYGVTLALAAFVGLCSYSVGDSGGLVVLKTILAPLYALSVRAVPTFFREPIVEPRWTGRAVESYLLTAALFAAFMTLFLWKPELTATAIIVNFLWFAAVMGVTQLIILAMRIRQLRKGEA